MALEGYGASSRIRAALPQMPGGMSKIGTLLLTDPSLPLRLSITELAEQAGTSPATVTRFCRAIGYTGYLALRVGAAAEQGRSSAHETWASDIGRAFHPDDTATEVMHTLVNAHTVALTSTAERLDPDLAGQVADAVAASSHVDIYGIGGSAGMADRAAGAAVPDRDQRPRVERGARRPHQRRPAGRLERRDRLLQHRPHRGDPRDAGPGEVDGCLCGRGDQRPGLPDGPGRRRPPDQPRTRGVPPARRPVGQARAAVRDRPAVPAGGTTGLLADHQPAGRLRRSRRAASTTVPPVDPATDPTLHRKGQTQA